MRSLVAGLLLSLALAGAAVAQERGYVTTNVNLRAGPGTDYPVVVVLGAGAPLGIFGCLDDYSWCDVAVDDVRGWVAAAYIEADYRGRRVEFYDYAPSFGVPIVAFSFNDYWGRYYRGRPWYTTNDRWYRPRPPGPRPGWRPPPPGGWGPGGPVWNGPGRPGGPGGPGWGGPGNPGGPGGRPPQGGRPEQGRPPGQGGRPEQGRPPGQGGRPEQGRPPGQGGRPEQGRPPGQGGRPEQGRPPQQGGRPEQGRPPQGQRPQQGRGQCMPGAPGCNI